MKKLTGNLISQMVEDVFNAGVEKGYALGHSAGKRAGRLEAMTGVRKELENIKEDFEKTITKR